MIQATEVVKLILGKGTLLVGRLLAFDALQMKFREFKVERDPACALCGKNPKPLSYGTEPVACAVPAAGAC